MAIRKEDLNREQRRMALKGRHSNFYTKDYKSSKAKEYARSILGSWK